MKKFLLTMVLSMLLCTNAFGAEIKLHSAIADENSNITIDGSVSDLAKEQQISFIITPIKDGVIDPLNTVYIDQFTVNSYNFSVSVPAEIDLENGLYAARIGGENIDKPHYLIINKKSDTNTDIMLGDVNGDKQITSADSSLVLQYVLNKSAVDFSQQQLYNANVTSGTQIDSSCAAWILAKTLISTTVFPAE